MEMHGPNRFKVLLKHEDVLGRQMHANIPGGRASTGWIAGIIVTTPVPA
eukprot:CAMPEP_0179218676 /NCGR_PEP_ID=MMETSP0797-20121207/4599_1 /TAXON_ID=47934 /ORGANISM="Dinophysis acuminata, Strain DAEP01" /LENGTH=48 /DNA_ID= /DNA_START= /DNA_END= /DNA_ORIENTATION=